MRMTMAQAVIRFLKNQYTERDGVEQPLFADIVSHQHPDHDTAVWPFEED